MNTIAADFFGGENFLSGENLLTRAKNFFREDLGEVVGAYFDGEKIYLVRLTETFESIEVYADGFEFDELAEKISQTCLLKGWKTSAVGFCLREDEVVTFRAEVNNVPENEFPALVKSWAVAQAGNDSAFAFTKIDGELWMETLPRKMLDDFCAACKKFGLNPCGISIMPTDLLTKTSPFDYAKFIAEVVRNRKAPNLLSARSSVWSWKKITLSAAAIFIGTILILSAKILFDSGAAESELNAAEISVEELRDHLALKEIIDADIAELNRLNKICAAQNLTPTKFNFLINLGKIAGNDVSLTKIIADENFLELEGLASTPDSVKNYLSRVKNSVAQSARLESSSELDDGEISFRIRATL